MTLLPFSDGGNYTLIAPYRWSHQLLYFGHTICFDKHETGMLRATSTTYQVFDPQFLGAARDRRRIAAGDDGDGDLIRCKQLDAGAILDVKLFELVACIAVDDAAVGQYAVYIKDDAPQMRYAVVCPLRL